jgi:hypothetical protein
MKLIVMCRDAFNDLYLLGHIQNVALNKITMSVLSDIRDSRLNFPLGA